MTMFEVIFSALFFIVDQLCKRNIIDPKKMSDFLCGATDHAGVSLRFFYTSKLAMYVLFVMILLILFWIVSSIYYQKQIPGLRLITAGVASNLVDLFWKGAIVNYLRIACIPVSFNIADIMIVFGITMCISSFLWKR